MSSSSRSSSLAPEEQIELPTELAQLSITVDEKPESLATGNKDIQLAALKATKYVFDQALQTELKSRTHIAELLAALAPSQAPQTRAQARAQANSKSPAAQRKAPEFKDVPLYELCVDGMDEEQIWAQLELRAQNLSDVLQYALDSTGEVPEEEDDDEDALTKRRKALLGDVEMDDSMDLDDLSFEDEDEEDSDSDEDSDEDDSDDVAESEDDDETEEEDVGEDEDLGEDVAELRDPSDGEGDLELDAPTPKQKKNRGKHKGKGHPELDDGFFDLAAFNAETEAAEAQSSSKGRLGDSDDEDEDMEGVDIFAPVGEEAEDDREPMYNDFFAPPSRVAVKVKEAPVKKTPAPKKGGVRFSNEVRVKKIKAKGKNLSLSQLYNMGEDDSDSDEDSDEDEPAFGEGDDDFGEVDDDDESEGDEDSGGEEDEDEEMGLEDEDVDMESQSEEESENMFNTIDRFKGDLFADDEEEQEQDLSTHEKRMAALREEITSLETENVSQKHWTLLGEATSKGRPQNALLEEDLEFERTMKSVPVITEEVVQGLEERIKARIVQGLFDDVVRRRPVDDKPFLPSRFFELQDTKSKQSLAEIYEDEYTAAREGGVAGEDRDGKLKKEHDEVDKQWDQICSKLDALCNAHFTPKAPKASISTIANVATTTLESAMPTTKASSTMLAPEEVFAPSAEMRARSELTPDEKRALRNKTKKVNKKARSKLEGSAALHSKAKSVGGVKRQKEAALKSVVKSGKGVTVIGKKSKETTQKR